MAHRNQPQLSTSGARNRLAALSEKKPPTKAAQLRILWPEIKAALDMGHSLKAVCECLEGDGLKMSVYTLGSYVTRMRRRSAQIAPLPASAPAANSAEASVRNPVAREWSKATIEEHSSRDPLANIRQSEAKRPAFDYRPELADPDKLI